MKILIFILLFFTLSINVVYSHKPYVHMYITREAYKLLNKQNICFSQMEPNIGIFSTNYGCPSYIAWQRGYITEGSYREDCEDVVFKHRGGLPPNYDEHVTNNHFWNADSGDGHPTTLHGVGKYKNVECLQKSGQKIKSDYLSFQIAQEKDNSV